MIRQPEENDLPENSRFWFKGRHSGGHVGLLPQGRYHGGRTDGTDQADGQVGGSKADGVSATAISSRNGHQVLSGSSSPSGGDLWLGTGCGEHRAERASDWDSLSGRL